MSHLASTEPRYTLPGRSTTISQTLGAAESFPVGTDQSLDGCPPPFTIGCAADGSRFLVVPWGPTEIVVRPSRNPRELEDAFGLVYRVYVNERGLIDANSLPTAQRQRQQKWDAYDFAPSTQHLLAVHEGRVVGTVRLLDGIGGMLPLDHNGFALADERARNEHIREVSKLIIDPAYRGGHLSDAMFWLVWWTCCFVDGLSEILLSCESPLVPFYQKKLRAVPIGGFMNREFGKEYVVMRVHAADQTHRHP